MKRVFGIILICCLLFGTAFGIYESIHSKYLISSTLKQSEQILEDRNNEFDEMMKEKEEEFDKALESQRNEFENALQDKENEFENKFNDLRNEMYVVNPNLLINGDFKVNQRGQSVYTTPNAYTVDRWIVNCGDQDFSLTTKENGGVTIQNNSDSDLFFVQFIEGKDIPWGKDVVFHIQTSQGEVSTSGTLPTIVPTSEMVIIQETTWESGGIYMYCFPQNKLQAVIRIHGNTTVDIEWAKVEIGNIATTFSPRTYAEELALCQRYYIANVLPYTTGYGLEGSIFIKVSLPTTMRALPILAKHGNIYVNGNGAYLGVAESVEVSGAFTNAVQIKVSRSDIQNSIVYAIDGESISLDAEIY